MAAIMPQKPGTRAHYQTAQDDEAQTAETLAPFVCSACPMKAELATVLADYYHLCMSVSIALTDTTVKGETTDYERQSRKLAADGLARAARPYQPTHSDAAAKMAEIASRADGGPVRGNPLSVECE